MAVRVNGKKEDQERMCTIHFSFACKCDSSPTGPTDHAVSSHDSVDFTCASVLSRHTVHENDSCGRSAGLRVLRSPVTGMIRLLEDTRACVHVHACISVACICRVKDR